MTINKKVLQKQITEELKKANEFCSQGHGRCYRMMIDTSDGKIWSDVFLSIWDYKIYHSGTIIALCLGGYYIDEVDEYVYAAIDLLKKNGWAIEV